MHVFHALYAVFSYALFLASFLYAIGFVGDLFVPKSINEPTGPGGWAAFLVDAAVLGVFAIQHSVMARPAFKRWWTRIIPKEAERSTYTLLSSVALIVLFAFWEPIGGTVWSVQSPLAQAAIYVAYAFGWGLVLVSTFLINHFDLFGLRQVWLQLRRKPYAPLPFKTPVLYRYVRHPLYVGWFFAFWATPTMTVAHLVFAVATTAYILIAIQLEERDLMAEHPEYAQYRKRVPMLVPFTKRRREAAQAVEAANSAI